MTECGQRATDALRRYAEGLAARIVALAGGDAVTTVFAGGSLAEDSVAWFEGDDLEILSDVDLYVVASDGREADVRRAAAVAVEDVAVEPGVRLLRPCDIGVVTLANLLAEPARPGTLNLPDQHLLLYGDGSVLAAMGAAMGAEIDPAEGLYLIENRLVELPADESAAADEASRRLQRYQLGKTVLDVVTAFLVSAREYRARLEDRMAALERLAGEEALPASWDDELVAVAARGRADLAGFLRDPAGEPTERRVRRFAVDTWEAIAGRLYGEHESRGLAGLILRRCKLGEYRRNFREFLALSSRWGGARSRRAWTAVHLSRYSPVTSLRAGALVAQVLARDDLDAVGRRSLEGLRSYLERLTEVCGFADGDLGARVRAAYKSTQSG